MGGGAPAAQHQDPQEAGQHRDVNFPIFVLCNRFQVKYQKAPDCFAIFVDVVHVGTRFFQQILHRIKVTVSSKAVSRIKSTAPILAPASIR
jgi:hypothetical protein